MTLHFTNTLTRAKEPFAPIDDKNVRMYVCGPTVYDFAHIGNARPAVVFDVLFRLLRHVYGEDHVTYVRNITDVDDKINARARRDFPDLPLNEAIAQVTQKTTEQYHADLAALGCLEPTHEPRATAHIPGMIAMIETLIAKGNAYVAEGPEGGEVLFDTVSMDGSSGPKYGALSKRNLDEQQAGVRIAVEEHKKNPGDFVLWKLSNADEPGWDSPWGRGRPGWHIECSVMSAHHLGETFDIHGGGLDLIFPHHENEIAQSCCANGTDVMANTWLHNGFVQVEGRKMSKSEGNFVTIHDVLHTDKVGGRSWPGEIVRLALLMTHYREPMDFSVSRLEEAENVLTRWRATWHEVELIALLEDVELASNLLEIVIDDLDVATLVNRISERYASPELSQAERVQVYHWMAFLGLAPSREEIKEILRPVLESANTALDGLREVVTSFSLPKIEIFDFAVHARGTLELFEDIQKHSSAAVTVGDVEELEKTIDFNSLNEEIAKRLAGIAEKNWTEADRIRDELAEKGIQLKDGKDLETGERTTTWEVKR